MLRIKDITPKKTHKLCKFYGRLGCKHGDECLYYHSKNKKVQKREERRILKNYDCHCGVGHPIRRLTVFCQAGWVCKGCGIVFADRGDDPLDTHKPDKIDYLEVSLDEWGRPGGICTTKNGRRMGIFYQKDDFVPQIIDNNPTCVVVTTRSGGRIVPFRGRNGKMMIFLNYGKKHKEYDDSEEDSSSLNLLRCRRQRSKGGRYPPDDDCDYVYAKRGLTLVPY